MTDNKVDFGRELVSPTEKRVRVQGVFDRVAERYDLMNDLMSLGSHRILKRIAIESTGLRQGQHALDVAGGTGDMSRLLAKVVGTSGTVTVVDINEQMVRIGRSRAFDTPGCYRINQVVGDAELLPFPNGYFHAVTIAFGIRNITDKERALREMHRVLRTEGKLTILEFSKPQSSSLSSVVSMYQHSWSLLGQLVVGDSRPYQYLAESIEKHSSPGTLALMIEDCGFKNVKYDNLLGGIVAMHRGDK